MAPTSLSVIYGVDGIAAFSPPEAENTTSFACGHDPYPVLLIPAGATAPLRFNNAPPDLLPEAPNPEIVDPFEMIHQRMLPLCDPWNTAARAFLEGYLHAIDAIVAENAAAIAGQAVACPDLFEPRDWVFSAPCPLPRAHVPTAATDGGGRLPFRDAVDFAFWTGEVIAAVDVTPPSLLPKAARARRERLEAAGVRHLEGMPGTGTAAWMALIGKLLPAGSPMFWHGEAVPTGPFPNRALDALDSMNRI